MISAQNHRRQLSGNKYYLVVIAAYISLGTMSSCARKMVANTNGRDVQVIEPDLPSDKPETAPKVPDKIIVDTVRLSDGGTKPATEDPKKVIKPSGANYKETYNIKLLLPLKATTSAGTDLSNAKYVHYYAGVLHALQQLNNEGIKLNVEVFDTEASIKILDRADDIIKPSTDLIIGPFERDDVKAFAEKSKEAAIPLVSPWQTSSKTTTNNPYYIQLKPNLREHFRKLAISAMSDFRKGEVTIVGRNSKDFNAWVTYFREVAQEQGRDTNFFKTHYITEEAVAARQTSYGGVLSQKALIFPNYSATDETFLSNALRRLVAEKGGKKIVVYGMPLMYESDKIDFEYYHALSMRIVLSDFVDETYQDTKDFRRDYFDRYGEIPTEDAIKGYDMMLYMGRNLWKYGRKFQHEIVGEPASFVQSTFQLEKAKAEDGTSSTDHEKFDYFENKHLDIIEFKDSKFVVRP